MNKLSEMKDSLRNRERISIKREIEEREENWKDQRRET